MNRKRMTGVWAAAIAAGTALMLGLAAPTARGQCEVLDLVSGATAPTPSASNLVPGSVGDDRAVAGLTPPFPLRFFGQTFTIFGVSSNGVLQLGGGGVDGEWVNTALPNGQFGPAIFAFWDDLRTDTVSGGGVFTATTGTIGTRVFEVRWVAIPLNNGDALGFSVFFYESPLQPDFVISYAPGTLPRSQGSSATIGVQLSGTGPSSAFSLNTASVTSGLVLKPCPEAAFTYQGRLTNGGTVVNGTANLTFVAVDGSGTALGASVSKPATPVVDGVFTVQLPTEMLGNPSIGAARLRITANGTTLSPDQPVTLAPFANRARVALNAVSAATATTATTATTAASASSVPWTGVTGVPANVANAFSPWAASGANISFTGGFAGIGTASPAAALHVVGPASLNTALIESANPNGSWLNLSALPNGGRNWSLASTGSSSVEGPGRFMIRDTTGGVIRMLIDPTGNVGVGTIAPASRLHLAVGSGGIGSNWHIRLSNAAVSAPFDTGGIRQSDSGFLEASNTLTGVFARLSSLGTWTAVSDGRLKKDVQRAEPADMLSKALRVRPVNFHWIDGRINGGELDFGVIAQELEEVMPGLVVKPDANSEAGQPRTVDYSKLGLVAIGAVQQLKAEGEVKDRRIKELEERLAKLERMMSGAR